MSDVYFLDFKKINKKNISPGVKLLLEKSGLTNLFQPKDLVALKVHFGEEGNPAFVPASYYLPIIEEIKKAGARPFLTDTNTLYRGQRDNAANHLLLAHRHGFGTETTGVPIIIADGLKGLDSVSVKIAGQHFKEVKIASALYHADKLLALSHFKGHSVTGFGGALKNIGMGSASRGGKQQMHSDVKPQVNEKNCTGCGICINWCPGEAIKLTDKKIAVIDQNICYGCGECLVTCPSNAIAITWKETFQRVQEKMVEFALGLVQNKKNKIGFINFLINISPDCDCWSFAKPAIVADIGVLASFDVVAIDQASLDLVNQAESLTGLKEGQDKFEALYPQVSARTQLDYAEKLGLGQTKYNLISI